MKSFYFDFTLISYTKTALLKALNVICIYKKKDKSNVLFSAFCKKSNYFPNTIKGFLLLPLPKRSIKYIVMANLSYDFSFLISYFGSKNIAFNRFHVERDHKS